MSSPATTGRRPDPRPARTRAALVAAAQGFLASNTTNVSIQEITQAAGVGFGSFSNHFASKDELFGEAVAATLDVWGALRDEIVAGLDDPAEVFAVSLRMTGRLQRVYPELVRVLLHSGMSVLDSDRGLRPRAVADIQAGMASGRFTVPDAELAIMAAGGALLGVMQLLESRPDLDDAVTSDLMTERVLLLLGVEADEARRLCALPLPPLPSIA